MKRNMKLSKLILMTDEVRTKLIEYLGGAFDAEEDELLLIGLDQLLEGLGAEGYDFT